MKHFAAAVAFGAAGALAQSWGSWDPASSSTTTTSAAYDADSETWDPKKHKHSTTTTTTTSTGEWEAWTTTTTSTDPGQWDPWTTTSTAKVVAAESTSTSTGYAWSSWDSADPSSCAATSTKTVWADPTGAWGSFPSTLTETDTVTVWVGPSGASSTEYPTGAAPSGAAPADASSWGGEWPASPVTSQIASNAASWVYTAPLATATGWQPSGPGGLNCGNASTGLQEGSCNTADDRSTWCGGFDIDTDYYTSCPTGGKTVSYTWEITNGTWNFDGEDRLALLINGQTPGPLIEANWGDTIEITVTNSLQNNGTEIHWHGLWQRGTNSMDGVPGITSCALAPGQSRVYKFQVCQYGSSWYHSHWLTQYGDGLQGPIVIHGPASANYDIDMGPVMISDLFYGTAAGSYDWISHVGPGGSKNYLLNGKNTDANNDAGEHALWQVQPGKKHLFRLVNSAAQNMFSVHFDGHTMEVIAVDFVPIKPYTTDWLNIGIGQRYDVIITANQPSGNYFLRAVTQIGCPAGCDNSGLGSSNGILQYAGAALTLPQSDVGNKTINDFTSLCADEPLASIVPWVSKSAGSPDAFAAQASTLPAGLVTAVQTNDDGLVFRWFFNNGFMDANYTSPTLQNIAENDANNETVSNAIFLGGQSGDWVYVVIQNQFFAGHPIHLHGHDFYLLGQQNGCPSPSAADPVCAPILFSQSDVATLQFDNPPRRDTAMLGDNGWTAIGFLQDNPGTWLMHCHIVWHVDGGLALQFVEQADAIPNYVDQAFTDECSAYASYESENPSHLKLDGESGLRKRWMDKLMSTSAQKDVVRRSGSSQKQYLDSHLKRGLGDSHRHRHIAARR